MSAQCPPPRSSAKRWWHSSSRTRSSKNSAATRSRNWSRTGRLFRSAQRHASNVADPTCRFLVIRPILKYGAPVLHERARAVDAVTPEIDRLIDDMIETMYAAPGVGLAAPQIGVPFRIFVVDVSVGRDPAGL